MIDSILFISLLFSLNIVGYTYNNLYNKKFYVNLPGILIGFVVLLVFGSLLSVLSFQQVSNSMVWKISYLFLTLFSLIFIIWKKSIKDFIITFLDIKYLVFLILFIFILLLRMSNSDILNTEKLMEFMILSSSMSSSSIISQDLWFHNNTISYYSYGYFVFSSIPSLINMDPAIAYNYVLPIVISMSYLSMYKFINYFFHSDKKFLYLITPFIFLYIFFIGPFATVLELLSHSSLGSDNLFRWIDIDGFLRKENFEIFWPQDNWWWFSISRIISYNNTEMFYSDYTINEFPLFSVILGDIHPHILVLPFVLLAFSLIFNMFNKRDFSAITIIWINIIFLITIMINPWYLVILLWYIIVNIIFKNYDSRNYKSLKFLVITLIIQTILFITLLNPNSLLVFPYISNVKIISRFHHLFFFWGFSFIPIFLFISFKIFKIGYTKDLIRIFLLFFCSSLLIPLLLPGFILNLELFISFLINNLIFSFFLSSLIIIIKNESHFVKNVLILLFTSTVIILGTEFIFVVDHFNNRMNTVFKFYFINYIILNLISIYIILNFFNSIEGLKKYLSISIFILFIIPSIWWATASIRTRSIDNIGAFSTNGLDYLNESEVEAINFIKDNISKESIILEGVGKSYTRSNIISASTGRSTVLGWVNHQLQWRSDYELIINLDNQIEKFYTNPSLDSEIIKLYNVKYILLSTFEKKRYDLKSDSNFNEFKLIFENKDFKIFRLND